MRPASAVTGIAGLFVAFAVVFSMPEPLVAQTASTSREYRIKAAYLYNFGKYVRWPSDPQSGTGDDSAFTIGVVGDDPFGATLDRLARTKRLGGRPIRIRRIRKAADYGRCQILFVPRDAGKTLVTAVLGKARGAPCLIVGEERGFARSSGVVNFFIQQNRIRFEINPRIAKSRGLRISSKLLRLGRIVGKGSTAGN